MPPLPVLDSPSSEQKDLLILELYELVRSQAARIAQLEAEVRALRAQVQALQAQRAKDSRTSGKPPSSDGLKKPPRPRSERVKGARRAGGFPAGVEQAVHYGERLKALSVYLKDYQLLPYERQRERFADVFGHRLSVAGLLKAEARCAAALAEPLAAIHRQLLDAPVMHFDETGLRTLRRAVEGRRHWRHTAGTETLTLYRVDAKRGQAAMDAIGLLPNHTGVAVHDGLHGPPRGSYFTYEQCTHALCNAHHLRELRFIHEQYGQAWAADLRLLLRLAHRLEQGHGPPLTDTLKARLEQWYDQLLSAGAAELPADPVPPPGRRGRRKQHPARNLHQRLRRYQTETLRFLHHPEGPFDNNGAERDLRMIKTRQKVSGTFRRVEGAQRFARIRSHISTARKQGQRLLEVIRSVFTGRPWMPGTESGAE